MAPSESKQALALLRSFIFCSLVSLDNNSLLVSLREISIFLNQIRQRRVNQTFTASGFHNLRRVAVSQAYLAVQDDESSDDGHSDSNYHYCVDAVPSRPRVKTKPESGRTLASRKEDSPSRRE